MMNMRTKYPIANFLLVLTAASSACAHGPTASGIELCAAAVSVSDTEPDRVQFVPKKSGCMAFAASSEFSSFIARVPVFSERGMRDADLREGILLLQQAVNANKSGKYFDLPEEAASFADRASEVSIHEEPGSKLIVKFEFDDGGVLVSREHGEIDAAYVVY